MDPLLSNTALTRYLDHGTSRSCAYSGGVYVVDEFLQPRSSSIWITNLTHGVNLTCAALQRYQDEIIERMTASINVSWYHRVDSHICRQVSTAMVRTMSCSQTWLKCTWWELHRHVRSKGFGSLRKVHFLGIALSELQRSTDRHLRRSSHVVDLWLEAP